MVSWTFLVNGKNVVMVVIVLRDVNIVTSMFMILNVSMKNGFKSMYYWVLDAILRPIADVLIPTGLCRRSMIYCGEVSEQNSDGLAGQRYRYTGTHQDPVFQS